MHTDKLFVAFTMDVERIFAHSPVGGPPDWAYAERSTRGYCDYLLARGFPVTMFVVPDTAEKQGDMLRNLADAGHECGLHIHDQGWKDHWKDPDRYDYFGGYSLDHAHAMLCEARDQFVNGIGLAPCAFRPGNFSANDDTFEAALRAGLTYGSVSQPERYMCDCKADWRGACRTVHRANVESRGIPGDLEFVEIPVTVSPDVRDNWTGTGDLRFEGADADTIIAGFRKELRCQVDAQTPLKHLCQFTHNFVPYWSETEGDTEAYARLKAVVAALPEIASEHGLTVKGATLKEVRDAYVEMECI